MTPPGIPPAPDGWTGWLLRRVLGGRRNGEERRQGCADTGFDPAQDVFRGALLTGRPAFARGPASSVAMSRWTLRLMVAATRTREPMTLCLGPV